MSPSAPTIHVVVKLDLTGFVEALETLRPNMERIRSRGLRLRLRRMHTEYHQRARARSRRRQRRERLRAAR